MTTLEQRWESVEESVEEACAAAGRARSDVRVIGVSKTVGLDAVAEAIEAGIHDFGENRPDELVRKHDAFPSENWHFIGNIQSRQLDKVVGRACLIHSLYQESHADKIVGITHIRFGGSEPSGHRAAATKKPVRQNGL